MFSKYDGIADITLISRNMLGKSMNSIPLLMNGILMKCLMLLISYFSIGISSRAIDGKSSIFAPRNFGR